MNRAEDLQKQLNDLYPYTPNTPTAESVLEIAKAALEELARLQGKAEAVALLGELDVLLGTGCNAAIPDAVLALQERVAELRGGPPGPWENCRDCGRAMVWDRDAGTWMCPRCTLARKRDAERRHRSLTFWIELLETEDEAGMRKRVAELEAENERLQAKLEAAEPVLVEAALREVRDFPGDNVEAAALAGEKEADDG